MALRVRDHGIATGQSPASVLPWAQVRNIRARTGAVTIFATGRGGRPQRWASVHARNVVNYGLFMAVLSVRTRPQ